MTAGQKAYETYIAQRGLERTAVSWNALNESSKTTWEFVAAAVVHFYQGVGRGTA